MDLVNVPDKYTEFECGLGGCYDDKCRITLDSKAMNDLIIIEIVEQSETRNQRGGIYLPESVTENCDLLKGKIISVGKDAKKFNVKKGDVVLYDKASAYYGPPETVGTVVITHVDNLIYVLD